MKTKFFLIGLIFIVCACKEENELPTVITLPATEVTWEHAITGGEVINEGSSPVTERGCIYSHTSNEPFFGSSFYHFYTADGSGSGEFTSKVGIVYAGAAGSIAVTNYIRAYATNSFGTAYGEIISVFPKTVPPVFGSISLIDVNSNTAVIEFKIELNRSYGYGIDEFYFCYSTRPTPTIEGTYTVYKGTSQYGGLTGQSTISNLNPNTTYYVRGYIKNESGYAYSQEISFKTLSLK